MCDNQDLKNYVDVMRLDACCKRREALKSNGTEAKELSLESSSASVSAKKHVSIAGHSKVNGSRSLDSRLLKTEGKAVPKGILRSKETSLEKDRHRLVVCPPRVNEGRRFDFRGGDGNERILDGAVNVNFTNVRKNSVASIRKEATGEQETAATCSAHGTKARPSTSSSAADYRTAGWGPVKATKVSPPRMKRRKKKIQSLSAPKSETRQSRLAALLFANQLSNEIENKTDVRRRSPPKPTAENDQATGAAESPVGTSGKHSIDAVVPEILLCADAVSCETAVDGRSALQNQSPVVIGEGGGLAFRNRTSTVQSSPDFTSDDTDGGGSKDSGYVTLEDLQAQLLRRSTSSGDEREADFKAACDGAGQGEAAAAENGSSEERQNTVEQEEEEEEEEQDKNRTQQTKDASLLQFTFTVKLDSSSLMKRRPGSLARRGASEAVETEPQLSPVVAGQVDVVVSEFRSQEAAAGDETCSAGFDDVDGCVVARDTEFLRFNAPGRTAKDKDEVKSTPESPQSERISLTFLDNSRLTSNDDDRRNANSAEKIDNSDNNKMKKSSENDALMIRESKREEEEEEDESSGFVDAGTYLRPISKKGSGDHVVAREAEVDSRPEAIYMSWQEVVAEAQTLGIPLNIPRQRRSMKPSRLLLDWEDRRRSLTSADSSGESELPEAEEEEEGEEGQKIPDRRKLLPVKSSSSPDHQGAVLFRARKTLRELLRMRNPFGRASKKKKSKRHQRGGAGGGGGGGGGGGQRECESVVPSSSSGRGSSCRHCKTTGQGHPSDETPTTQSSGEVNSTAASNTHRPKPNRSASKPTNNNSSSSSSNVRSSLTRQTSVDEFVEFDDEEPDQPDPGVAAGGTGPRRQQSARSGECGANSFIENILSMSPGLMSRGADFVQSLNELQNCGWYWGQMELEEAEMKLANKPDGTFLVRDSSDDRYILSLGFRSLGGTHHTRIEHYKGMFGFHSQMQLHGVATIVEFINKAMELSKDGRCVYYLRPRGPGLSPAPVRLLHPLSRFRCLHSLKHLCKFIVLRYVRLDLIDRLPISPRLKEYLKGGSPSDPH